MQLNELLSGYNLETKELNGKEHIVYPTDFENLLLRLDLTETKECTLEMNDLLRFINPVFLEDSTSVNYDILECHFLPSHIENELLDEIASGSISKNLAMFCPDFLNPELNDDDDYIILDSNQIELPQIKEDVKHKDREKRSTSLFKIENVTKEVIIETVKALHKEIYSLRNHKVVIGCIKDKGLLQRANNFRTENPNSVHYSFWKISKEHNVEFKDILSEFNVFPY